MIYYILLIWIYLIGILSFCSKGKLSFNKNKRLFINLVFILIIIILGFRNKSVGVDTEHYSIIFDQVSKVPFRELIKSYYFLSIEIGYVLLMKLTSYIGNYYFFQTLIAILSCALYANFIRLNMDNLFFGVILFIGLDIYLQLFNITRQMLAVALIVNVWTYLNKSQLNKAIILYVCAVLMHITASLFIILFILYLLKYNTIVLKMIPILGTIILLSYESVLNYISNFITHYANYYANQKNLLEIRYAFIIWILILIFSVLMIISSLIYININSASTTSLGKSTIINNIYNQYISATFSLFYVIANYNGLYFNYFERLGYYFSPFVIILFEQFGCNIKNNIVRRIYYIGVVISVSIYFIISTQSNQYDFSFFWD